MNKIVQVASLNYYGFTFQVRPSYSAHTSVPHGSMPFLLSAFCAWKASSWFSSITLLQEGHKGRMSLHQAVIMLHE